MINQTTAHTRRQLLKTTAVGLTGTLGTGLFGSAAAQESDPTVITEPITITEPGTYVLENDIEHNVPEPSGEYDYQPFIEIGSYLEGDVTIDGKGHEISGQGFGNGIFGIELYNGKVTVHDLTIRNLGRGVFFDIGPAISMEKVSITECTGTAILQVDNSFDASNLTITENGSGVSTVHAPGTITDSTITDNGGNGLSTTNTKITDSTLSRNGTGVYLPTGNEAIITDCNIQRNDINGINSTDAYNVTVTDSQISHNGQHGLNVYYGSNWDIHKNTINHNREYGAYLDNTDDSQLIENTIIGNDGGAIFLSDNSEGTVIEGNRTGGQGPPDRRGQRRGRN